MLKYELIDDFENLKLAIQFEDIPEIIHQPTIVIERRDRFADGAAYYVGVFWLMFQIYIVIRTKK